MFVKYLNVRLKIIGGRICFNEKCWTFSVTTVRITFPYPGRCKGCIIEKTCIGKKCAKIMAETSINFRFRNINGCTRNEGLLIEKAVHARRRLSLFQKPARGSALPCYHIFARTSQTDRRSNESVITDVAQNNENLLVGTAFNSDAIHLGVHVQPHTCARVRLESRCRTNLPTLEGRSGQEGCNEKFANKIYFMSTKSL